MSEFKTKSPRHLAKCLGLFVLNSLFSFSAQSSTLRVFLIKHENEHEGKDERRNQRGTPIMAYWQLFYHCVWPTNGLKPWLTAAYAPLVHQLLRDRVQLLGGTPFAVGGVADHVHVAVSIPPQMAISVFVGQVKSWSSGQINRKQILPGRFTWHESYGVHSFDRRRLPNVIAYVNQQAGHHAVGTTIPILERTHGDPSLAAQRDAHQSFYIDNQALAQRDVDHGCGDLRLKPCVYPAPNRRRIRWPNSTFSGSGAGSTFSKAAISSLPVW